MLQELLPANLIPVLEAEEWKQVTIIQLSVICSCRILLILLRGYCNIMIISCCGGVLLMPLKTSAKLMCLCEYVVSHCLIVCLLHLFRSHNVARIMSL